MSKYLTDSISYKWARNILLGFWFSIILVIVSFEFDIARIAYFVLIALIEVVILNFMNQLQDTKNRYEISYVIYNLFQKQSISIILIFILFILDTVTNIIPAIPNAARFLMLVVTVGVALGTTIAVYEIKREIKD